MRGNGAGGGNGGYGGLAAGGGNGGSAGAGGNAGGVGNGVGGTIGAFSGSTPGGNGSVMVARAARPERQLNAGGDGRPATLVHQWRRGRQWRWQWRCRWRWWRSSNRAQAPGVATGGNGGARR
jgi:hypothetical protein